jgi:enamine deaminase RidA (YjgF/YER057c/UK114 family)
MMKVILLKLLLLSTSLLAQEFHNPSLLFDPSPFGFSHSAKVLNQGTYIFISGQSGSQDLKHTLSGDFRKQVQQALQNIKHILDSHELKPENIVKITILIVDHNEEKLRIWTEEMKVLWNQQRYPASTLIPVPTLALPGMQIEIDAIAFKKK